MGGVDLHDGHCSNLMPCIRSKKWTCVIFMRLIQEAITNATLLTNLVTKGKKIGTKDMGLAIAKAYFKRSKAKSNKCHKIERVKIKKNCSNFAKCGARTQRKCATCNVYVCVSCFVAVH